jgi:hypothetical protein
MAQAIKIFTVGNGSSPSVYPWSKNQADTEAFFAPGKVVSIAENSPGVFSTYNTNNITSVFVYNQ